MADTDFSQVTSSYNDVNTALEGLVSNISSGSNITIADVKNAISSSMANTVTSPSESGTGYEIDEIGFNRQTGQVWAHNENTGEYAFLQRAGDYASMSDVNQAVESVASQSVPAGTIVSFGSNNIPSGYLLCNGATFSQTNFPNLYAALGSSTLPDMRGMFLRGLDTSGSVDNFAGTRTPLSFEEGSYLVSKENNDPGSPAGLSSFSTWASAMQSINNDLPQSQSANIPSAYSSHGSMEIARSPTGFTAVLGVARPKNIAVNYIIKAS